MEYFEEEFRRRFADAESADKIDPDKIWEGITDALNSDDGLGDSAEEPKKKRWRFFLLFFFAAATFSLFLLTYNFENKTAINDSKITVTNKDFSPLRQQSIKKPFSEETSEGVQGISKKESPKDPSSKIGNEKQIYGEDKKERKAYVARVKNRSESDLVTDSNQKEVISRLEESSSKEERYGAKQLGGGITKSDKDSGSVASKNENNVEQERRIPMLPISLLSPLPLEGNQFEPGMAPEVVGTTKTIAIKQKKKKLAIGIFLGSNFIANRYQKTEENTDYRTLLKDGDSGELGYSTGVEANWRLSKKLNFVTGVEFTHTQSEFNLVRTWDTVKYRNDDPTADLIRAEATRTVRHHNVQKYISVPLMIGFSNRYKRIDFGVNVGIGINYLTWQKGKSVNHENKIKSYGYKGLSNDELPYEKLFLSYRIDPYLQYRTNSKWAVQVRSTLRFQDYGQSAFYKLNHSSLLSGLSIGIIFTP